MNAICSIDASNYSEFNRKANEVNASGDSVYGLFKLNTRAEQNYQQFKSEFKFACSKISDEEQLRSVVDRSSSTINASLSESFNQCIKTIAKHAEESRFNVFQTVGNLGSVEGKKFTIYLTFAADRRADTLKILAFSPSIKCTFGDEVIRPGKKFQSSSTRAEFAIECDPENEQIDFTIVADGGLSTNKVRVPKWQDPVPDLRSHLNAVTSKLTQSVSELQAQLNTLRADFQQRTDAISTRLNNRQTDNPAEDSLYGEFQQKWVILDCPANQFVTGYALNTSAPYDTLGSRQRSVVGMRIKCGHY